MRVVFTSAIPFVFLVTVGVAAVDFGSYWDDEAMFTKVRRSLAASPPTLLPHAYDYPGVTFLMALAALAPEAMHDGGLRRATPDTSDLEAFTHTDAYRLRTRAFFVAVSSLAAVWVAGLCLAIDGVPWEAFLASALFATSWEVGYHIRWIAPDGVTAMFVTAAVMCAAYALRSHQPARLRWVRAAAILAGLATASKYSAWPCVLVVLAAAWLCDDDGAASSARWRQLFTLGALSVAAFFVTSPGTLLQPTLAVSQIRAQVAHYSNGHGIYTVGRGADHLWKMLVYDALVLPSPYLVVAAAFSLSAVLGALTLARQSRRTAFVALAFPVFFTAYFALQKTMIVRNLLVIAPFASVLAARGVRTMWEAAGRRGWHLASRGAIAGVVGLGVALNIAYQISAIQQVNAGHGRGTQYAVDAFRAWFLEQPRGSVYPTGRLAQVVPPSSSAASAAAIAIYAIDAAHAGVRPNAPRTFSRAFGPQEVNLNYYPDWPGDEHVVLMSRAQAVHYGILDR